MNRKQRRAGGQGAHDTGRHIDLGVMLMELGRFDQAEASFAKALKEEPKSAAAFYNLGNLRRLQGRPEEALSYYAKAASHPDAHNNRGLLARTLGRLSEAEESFRLLLSRLPDHAPARCNLGLVLNDLGREDEAVLQLRLALALAPSLAEAQNGFGQALTGLGRADRAERFFFRCLALQPGNAEALHNLGVAWRELGRLGDALAAFDAALERKPDMIHAHFAQSLTLLQAGDWRRGWRKFEFRRHPAIEPRLGLRRLPQPLWSGDAAAGRTILLWSEQGFGDTIMFARFAGVMARQGWRVVLEVQKELKRLCATLPGVIAVAAGEPLPPVDVHFPLLSVPGAIGVTLETLPAPPVFHLPAEWLARWRLRPAGNERLRVGICWRGSRAQKRDRRRSIRPEIFARLLDLPGLDAVVLQNDATAEELAVLRRAAPLIDPGKGFADFADTASLIAGLDLVITVDTAVCHLAGALGVPTWALLDHGADWQWMAQPFETPWYQLIRLFRQPSPGDWGSVAGKVREELCLLLAEAAEQEEQAAG